MKKRNTLMTAAIAALFAAPMALAAGGAGSAGAPTNTGAGKADATTPGAATSATGSGSSSSSAGAGSATSGAGTSGSTQVSAERAFEKLDANNDGFISKPEAGIAPDVIVIFPAADTDKDDKLSRSEYDEGMKSQSAQGGTTGGSTASQGASQSGQPAVGNRDRRPGKDEGDYTPKGNLGGDPLRSPPSASGSGR